MSETKLEIAEFLVCYWEQPIFELKCITGQYTIVAPVPGPVQVGSIIKSERWNKYRFFQSCPFIYGHGVIRFVHKEVPISIVSYIVFWERLSRLWYK